MKIDILKYIYGKKPAVLKPNGGNSIKIDKLECFQIVYSREPNKKEKRKLRSINQKLFKSTSDVFRAVISIFDGQEYYTPFKVALSKSDIETLLFHGNKICIDKWDFSVGAEVKHTKKYEEHVTEFLQRSVKAGMTFVDIGANIGTHSITASKLVGNSGKVIAFEPSSENCKLILLNCNVNDITNLELFPFALSNKFGYCYLTHHIGTNAGVALSEPECVNIEQKTIVPMAPLDSLIDFDIDFIKTDTEGADYLALSGGERNLRKSRPVIVSEFSLEMLSRVSRISGLEYLQYIQNLGYKINLLDKSSRSLLPVEDLEKFISSWGSLVRIEELVFHPI